MKFVAALLAGKLLGERRHLGFKARLLPLQETELLAVGLHLAGEDLVLGGIIHADLGALGVEADELRHHELRGLVLLGHEAQFAHEQAEPARLEQANALVGQNIFGHGGARQLGKLAFAAGAGDHGAHRLSELERVAARLLYVAEDGDRPVLLDAETDGGLNQDAFGETVLNELLRLSLVRPPMGTAPRSGISSLPASSTMKSPESCGSL